ncbi:QueT transporter family protein [Sedimentibacter sp. MB31-C6]|uniref:QueT transporter family protein n=1 Tax=Sedimentibacter sp. MB31-C6 TaxID=3109366 RepID=UPI002DDD2012|nr:QueT transporter family protein [Sedimentibacter sp. MB36-C1]WSI03893.1 QueT transporter family protein [Sedimentibacter sp. MB36-C1]
MKKNKIQFITRTALIAALYAALTYAFAWLGYEQVQFRVSEILVLFAFIEPKYGLGLILGCVLANLPSPLGLIDIVVGSFATLMAIMFIVSVRKLLGYNKKALIIASLGPVISNAILVGLELTYVFNTPFLWNAFYVAVGELVVVTIMGTVIVNSIMKKDILVEKIIMN